MGSFLRKLGAFIARDFFQEVSYRLSFAVQIYGSFFAVTLFYFVARLVPHDAAAIGARYGSGYFPFVLVGLAFIGFMTSGMSAYAASIRQGQMLGTLEAMLVTPTSLPTIVLASSLWTFVRASLNMVIYFAIGCFFGLDLTRANWLGALAVLVLALVVFSALGVLSASLVLAFKRGDPVAAVFGGLSGLLGGAFFPVELLPPWLQRLAQLVPLRHALEGMRQALLRGAGVVELARIEAALALFAAVLLPLAVLAFRLAVRKAKRDGSLAQY